MKKNGQSPLWLPEDIAGTGKRQETGRRGRILSLEGLRYAERGGQPAFLKFPGDDRRSLPLFETDAELVAAYANAGAKFDLVRTITNEVTFAASMRPHIRRGEFRLIVGLAFEDDGHHISYGEVTL